MHKKICIGIVMCLITVLLCACSRGGHTVHNRDYDSSFDEDEVSTNDNDERNTESDNDEAEKDYPSIWFDGVEFKILEYIDNDYMLVKFLLEDYIIQTVVPRRVETDKYDSEFYVENYGGVENAYLKLSAEDRNEAIFFSYGKGESMIEEYGDGSYEAIKNAFGGELVESKTSEGKAIFYKEGNLDISIYEYEDETEVDGYDIYVPAIDQQTMFVFAVLNEDENQCKKDLEELLEIKYKKTEDSDFIRNTTLNEDEYTARLDAMYSKYIDMALYPDNYLREQWNAPGEGYDYQQLADMTNDGIPEVFFMGNPKSICIMGEKNVITLWGDEIFWGDEPNVFYVDISYPGEFTYVKYELILDENGNIAANILDSSYLNLLEETDDYINYTTTYSFKGDEISEKEYWSLVEELKAAKHLRPKLYDTDEFVAGKTMFKRSAMRLTGKRL